MAREFAIKNPAKLLENMLLIRDILSRNEIMCFLHYGTLLGAIRERNFIPHDDDADWGVFGKDFDKLLALLPEFLREGFSFKSQRNGRLLQFVRAGEQVDIFFAYMVFTPIGRRWDIDTYITLPYRYLSAFELIQFPSSHTPARAVCFIFLANRSGSCGFCMEKRGGRR